MNTATSNIEIKEINSGESLMSFNPDQIDQAYEYATEMEILGIEVKVIIPNVQETLASELGLPESQIQELRDSMASEIEDHEGQEKNCLSGSCTFE